MVFEAALALTAEKWGQKNKHNLILSIFLPPFFCHIFLLTP